MVMQQTCQVLNSRTVSACLPACVPACCPAVNVCCLQELRLLFDASGGGGRLNTIQLCALLQHMARLAPAPELLNATERAELGAFADEVSS